MKKGCVLLLLAFTTTTLLAQKNSIRLNMFNLFQNQFKLNYERLIKNDKIGINISPILTLRQNYSSSTKGIGGELSVRSYLFEKPEEQTNFYSNIFGTIGAEYNYYEVKYMNYYYDYYNNTNVNYSSTSYLSNYQVFIALGWQGKIKDKLVLESYLGAGIKENSKSKSYYNSYYNPTGLLQIGHTGVIPKLGVNIGIMF